MPNELIQSISRAVNHLLYPTRVRRASETTLREIKMNKMNAVLWDNDGVLLDSETIFFECTKSSFHELGLHLTKPIWCDQYLGKGISSRDVAIFLGGDPNKIDPVITQRNNNYLIALSDAPKIRPRVTDTLTALSGHVKMGIVTGCSREQLRIMHHHTELLEFFDVVVTADDYNHSKPSPVPYLSAVAALGLDASNCIAVEDSQRGLMSALAAGVACMIVPTDLTAIQNFSGAVSVEDDVSAILKYIDI